MKILTGKITSKLGEKTAKVTLERVIIHPIYKKRFKREKTYLVYDETGAKVGDIVKFSQSRPYSKLKKWRIVSSKGVRK